MPIEAVFENIAERILSEIKIAENSIFIAVAWFTNKGIFDQLVIKANEGCQVFVIISDDHINQNSRIDFNLLNIKSSKVFKIGDGNNELMHNKFCVIDHCNIITGSYNWSYKAESNFENIVVTNNDTTLAEQFIAEFHKIREKYHPESKDSSSKDFPLSNIIKRLEILKNYVILEEIEDLKKGVSKLMQYDFNSEINEIIHLINDDDFGEAVNRIQIFINRNQQLSIWINPEIAALKLEIKNLENLINAFDNEKNELNKILSEFQHRHSRELGEIILEILRLRKMKFENDREKFDEAQKDEEEYRKQFESEKQKEIFQLDEQTKGELKKMYRKATMLCHPDKFSNESIEIQAKAEAIFKELNEANAKNDFKKVAQILEDLKKGILTTSKEDGLSDKDIIKATIERLKIKLQQLEVEIVNIKQSETYITIMSIVDWGVYFKNVREKLEKELKGLKENLV